MKVTGFKFSHRDFIRGWRKVKANVPPHAHGLAHCIAWNLARPWCNEPLARVIITEQVNMLFAVMPCVSRFTNKRHAERN